MAGHEIIHSSSLPLVGHEAATIVSFQSGSLEAFWAFSHERKSLSAHCLSFFSRLVLVFPSSFFPQVSILMRFEVYTLVTLWDWSVGLHYFSATTKMHWWHKNNVVVLLDNCYTHFMSVVFVEYQTCKTDKTLTIFSTVLLSNLDTECSVYLLLVSSPKAF